MIECARCHKMVNDVRPHNTSGICFACASPRPEPSPCKHYFTGGGLIKVCCMKCNELESRSIYYPDETYTRQREMIEELTRMLDSEHNEAVTCNSADVCVVCKLLTRSREMLGA